MKVSVITPAYNAAGCIERCAQSIISQTWKDLEWIVVDDCSTDATAEMVKDLSIVVRLPENQGVAAARNAGLDVATGDYIYFVDADDYLEPDAVEKMMLLAKAEDLDIVGCEWNLCFPQSERPMKQPSFASPIEAMSAMMQGTMRWNLWLFMIRRSLWDGVRFAPGKNMGEDMSALFRLMLKAGKIGLVKENLYHYSQPTLSRDMSEANISQVTYNIGIVEEAVRKSPYSEKLLPLLPQLKLNVKLPLLVSSKMANYRRWAQWFPEADAFVMDNKALPLRTRLLMWCAARKLWCFVWLYYWLVNRFVYGVIYR